MILWSQVGTQPCLPDATQQHWDVVPVSGWANHGPACDVVAEVHHANLLVVALLASGVYLRVHVFAIVPFSLVMNDMSCRKTIKGQYGPLMKEWLAMVTIGGMPAAKIVLVQLHQMLLQ